MLQDIYCHVWVPVNEKTSAMARLGRMHADLTLHFLRRERLSSTGYSAGFTLDRCWVVSVKTLGASGT
jgi:hypothetical protein